MMPIIKKKKIIGVEVAHYVGLIIPSRHLPAQI